MFHELKIDSYVHMYIFCYFRFFLLYSHVFFFGDIQTVFVICTSP